MQAVGLVLAVFFGRDDSPLDGDSVVIFRAGMDLLGRRDIQKLTALEMCSEQGLDMAAELSVLAASLVQISASGGGVGLVQGSEKDLFFRHGAVSARDLGYGPTPNAKSGPKAGH